MTMTMGIMLFLEIGMTVTVSVIMAVSAWHELRVWERLDLVLTIVGTMNDRFGGDEV